MCQVISVKLPNLKQFFCQTLVIINPYMTHNFQRVDPAKARTLETIKGHNNNLISITKI